jgi:hypothetical protein
MPKSSVSMCLIEYDQESQELELRVIGTGAGKIETYGKNPVPRDELKRHCENYWSFVNGAVERGEVTGDDRTRRAFYDTLQTRGAALANVLMTSRTKQKLWRLAASSEVLVLITGLLNVPWEALFCVTPDGGTFLSQNCVITRWPENTADNSRDLEQGESSFSRERIVCIDSVLDQASASSSSPISDTFLSDGEEVYLTNLKCELLQRVSDVRVVHWICEHAELGLRLAEDVFYCTDDAEVHRFPRGGVLVLTSCQAATSLEGAKSVAGEISSSSDCTVIAPSSLVATRAGIDFARGINAHIRANPQIVTVLDLWKHIRKDTSNLNSPSITAENCFALWYGIYGDALAALRGATNAA